ncbi:MAG: histidine triad family protein, partial [Thermodesulfobacteriota bacterium]|nr:histidine triad family protein [Thermodesulfobacteriota bacterium]
CKIARAVDASLAPHGMNVMQLNGQAGNQVVPHLHMHLVPRWLDDRLTICAWQPVLGDRSDIALAADEIKAKISG